jgi:hypothetical protein
MNSIHPYKTDTDEFQLMQSIGCMEDAKQCLIFPVLCGPGQFQADFGSFGMKEGPK